MASSGEIPTSTPIISGRITRSMTKALKHANDDTKTVVVEKVTSTESASKPATRQKSSSPYVKTISASRTPPISALRFSLVQERTAHNLYQLLVATTLWNRTKGSQARPIFEALLLRYPTPEDLANSSEGELALLLTPLGLHNTRAKRLRAFAQTWLEKPPSKHRRYRKLHYPELGSGKDVGVTQVLSENDPREGWEIAHLPGMGPYALDSFRIFHRDMMRGLATDWNGTDAAPGFEPEWKRVNPQDKELKACISWMWLRDGWLWDASNGRKVKASKERMRQEHLRNHSLSPELL